MIKAGYMPENPDASQMEWLTKAVGTVQESLQYAAQVPDALKLFFTDDV